MSLGKRPDLPKYLMFRAKRIAVKCPAQPKIAISAPQGANGNRSIMFQLEVQPNQSAEIYSVPDGSSLRVGTTGVIPAGTILTYMKALTQGTMPYVIEALRAAGWEGQSLKTLVNGQLDGFGSLECFAQVDVSETIKENGEDVWRVEKDTGKFRPRMEVAFLNPGFRGFQKAATVDDLDDLDRQFGHLLRGEKAPAAAGGGTGTGNFPPAGNDDIPF